MKITTKSATIFITLVAAFFAADGLGSGGTTAVTYGRATVCGIFAGEPTRRIKCYQNGRAINVQPNVSFESISGGRSFFCGLRHGGSAVICWDAASFQPKRIYFNRTGPLTGLTVGEDHVCAAWVGSLHDHLHLQNDAVEGHVIRINSWKTRISILLGAARGVEYLHSYAVPPIIHRDIKSSNILLDSNWAARFSDFGLSLMGPGPSVSSTAVGTLGYIDPQYYIFYF